MARSYGPSPALHKILFHSSKPERRQFFETEFKLRKGKFMSEFHLETALDGWLDYEHEEERIHLAAFMSAYSDVPKMRVFRREGEVARSDSLPNVEHDIVLWDDWRQDIWGYEVQGDD